MSLVWTFTLTITLCYSTYFPIAGVECICNLAPKFRYPASYYIHVFPLSPFPQNFATPRSRVSLPKSDLVGAILLVSPQDICSTSLDHSLHRRISSAPFSSPKMIRLTVLVMCLCNPSSPSSCTACPFAILLKLSLIKNS